MMTQIISQNYLICLYNNVSKLHSYEMYINAVVQLFRMCLSVQLECNAVRI